MATQWLTLAPAVPVDRHRDYHGTADDPAVLAYPDVGCIEPEIGPDEEARAAVKAVAQALVEGEIHPSDLERAFTPLIALTTPTDAQELGERVHALIAAGGVCGRLLEFLLRPG